MVYRVLKTLSLGGDKVLKVGEFTRLEWLTGDKVARLMKVGAVSEVAPPPLSELPGWKARAQRLAAVGIRDTLEFLESDPKNIAKPMKVRPATIVRWQGEVKKWLVVESKG